MINLVPISEIEEQYRVLWELLLERTPEQSISHKGMPTFDQHIRFIQSMPYAAWYFIQSNSEIIGTIYLTHQREVGISIFNKHQGEGHGRVAIRLLKRKHPGKLLANINPKNKVSKKFFKSMNFKLIQETYEYE